MSKLLNFITRYQEQMHHSLLYRFPRLWEGLPLNVKELVISGVLPFITELRKHNPVPRYIYIYIYIYIERERIREIER